MLTDGLPQGARVLLSFWGHCLKRAFFVQRTMLRFLSFDDMLSSISPPATSELTLPEEIPQESIVHTAEFFAYLFPWIWRRRCLFRCLLVLDWARQRGIDPTLNVGVELGKQRDQGHCWLSVDGKPFCEIGGWPQRYGELFYESRKIQHWTGLAPNAPNADVSAGAWNGDYARRERRH
jgi:hypothetical protein